MQHKNKDVFVDTEFDNRSSVTAVFRFLCAIEESIRENEKNTRSGVKNIECPSTVCQEPNVYNADENTITAFRLGRACRIQFLASYLNVERFNLILTIPKMQRTCSVHMWFHVLLFR